MYTSVIIARKSYLVSVGALLITKHLSYPILSYGWEGAVIQTLRLRGEGVLKKIFSPLSFSFV